MDEVPVDCGILFVPRKGEPYMVDRHCFCEECLAEIIMTAGSLQVRNDVHARVAVETSGGE